MSQKVASSDAMFIKVNISNVQNGLIGKIGSDAWATLCVIGTFSNEQGESYPSQDTLAMMLGITRQAVNRRIAKLCSIKLDDGSAIIEKRLFNRGMGTRAFYRINPNSGVTFGRMKSNPTDNMNATQKLHELEPKQEPVEQDIKTLTQDNVTAKNVLTYFCIRYEDTYGVRYVPNYRKECSMIKSKLMKYHDAETLQKIIDTTFDYYDDNLATPKYPRPTIGQLCSWLSNKIVTVIAMQADKERTDRIEAENLSKFEQDDYTERLFAKAFGDLAE